MKLKGKTRLGPNVETIVIPRSNDDDLVFKARAVLSMSNFDKMVDLPEPPVKLLPGGTRVANTEDPNYQKALEEYGELKTAWTVINSLKETEDLEWEKVKDEEPSSWLQYREELEEFGLSEMEIVWIIRGVLAACGLDEQRMEEARERFLQEEQKQG